MVAISVFKHHIQFTTVPIFVLIADWTDDVTTNKVS